MQWPMTANATSPPESSPPESGTQKAGRSVLIVDDDDALVEALSELLREEGYRVETYTVAEGALARLREGAAPPDVVLLDYLMPTMNGDEFLAALDEAEIAVPVLLLSAMNESRVPRRSSLVRAVIRKPFDLDRLLGELAQIRAA